MKSHEHAEGNMRGDLLAVLNQDIRTSVHGITGMMALLLDAGLSPAQQQLAANARHCAENLMALIENVSDFSMIDTDRLALVQTHFDLLPALQTAFATPSAAARDKGLVLQIRLPQAVSLLGDAGRMRQIAGSLLNSAVGLTPHGEITVDVIAVCDNTSQCRVSMAIHMPAPFPAARQMIDSLNQPDRAGADLPNLPEHAGIALELTLCKQLARLMGAQIGVENRQGEQYCLLFSVELPQAPCSAGSRSSQEPRRATQPLSFAGRRILVADDNLVNRQVAQHMLEKFGCMADVATDGLQTVAMHASHPYDLVLMDCQMPQLDGYQATERIRALDGRARRTPIIALTARATQGEREYCLAKGMDDFIAKPVRPQMLEEVLVRWLPQVTPEQAAAETGCGDELEVVRDMFGSDFAELAMLYRNDSPPRIAALRQAGATKDYSQIVKVAHAFSGSCVSIGATGLSALCKELETRAKANSLENFSEKLAAIEDEYGRISRKLQAMFL